MDMYEKITKRIMEKCSDQIKSIVETIGNNWLYLMAAPNIQDGIPGNLSTVFTKYALQIRGFISEFYLGNSPKFDNKILSCSIDGEQNNILSIKLSIGSYYELLLFR